VGGRFFLIGGRGDRPVEEFDPATGSWRTRASAPIEMHHFQAVAYDGKVYVLGALTGGWPNEPPIPHVYVYDPATDQWTRGAEIPEGRRRGAAGAVVHDGLIYLVSGIQVGHSRGHVPWLDAFDPRTNQWRALADAPRPRDHFHAVVADGRLYAVGGRRSSAATNEPFQLTVPEVDVYDIATNRWTTLPSASNLPTERAGTAAVVYDGRVVVLGGESGSQVPAHDEVEALDPRTGTWTSLPRMNQGRHGTQAVLHDGRIWIAAGSRVRGAAEINSQEVFPAPP
jgi:N-acetylneuraminic acid mutarotase